MEVEQKNTAAQASLEAARTALAEATAAAKKTKQENSRVQLEVDGLDILYKLIYYINTYTYIYILPILADYPY